jgi:hypothetical protein
MIRRAATTTLLLLLLLLSRSARAESGTQYEFWFDALLNPAPDNPPIDKKAVVEGDSVTIHIDPTRLFSSAARIDSKALAFAQGEFPSELLGFYVATRGGALTPRYIQPGPPCVVDQATAATAPALVCAPDETGQWVTKDPDESVYYCAAKPAVPLASLVHDFGGNWSLVYDRPGKKGEPPTRTCLADYVLAPTGAVQQAGATIATGGALPETLPAVPERGVWTFTSTLKPGAVNIVVSLMRADAGPVPVTRRIPKFVVATRDEHSLVRVQAELLATNRARTVAFGVAISPVVRAFFKDGPWRHGCIAFCAITPHALIRLSGDQTTLLQMGVGLGFYVTPPIQFNTGLLFGTKDTTTSWSAERNFYVGFAIDPFLLAETKATAAAESK